MSWDVGLNTHCSSGNPVFSPNIKGMLSVVTQLIFFISLPSNISTQSWKPINTQNSFVVILYDWCTNTWHITSSTRHAIFCIEGTAAPRSQYWHRMLHPSGWVLDNYGTEVNDGLHAQHVTMGSDNFWFILPCGMMWYDVTWHYHDVILLKPYRKILSQGARCQYLIGFRWAGEILFLLL